MKAYLFSIGMALLVACFTCLRCHAEVPGSASNTVAADLSARSDASTNITNSSPAGVNDAPVELPIKYWGNSSSAKFHRPSCPFARAMNSRHVVLFHFRRDAIAAGQQPCRYCLPPFVERVEGKILPRTRPGACDRPEVSVKPGGAGAVDTSLPDEPPMANANRPSEHKAEPESSSANASFDSSASASVHASVVSH